MENLSQNCPISGNKKLRKNHNHFIINSLFSGINFATI